MTTQTVDSKLISKLIFVVIAMFGFGFALVPLYDVFCDITGLNGKTSDQAVVADASAIDRSRLVEVQFLANLNANMPWEFKPLTRTVEVNPGEPTKVVYMVKNNSNKDIIGQAVPSVAPGLAAAYFQKTECFCFTEQPLKAGEEKLMPVVFIVDSALPKHMNQLTLSYTFFTKPSSEQAAMPSLVAHNNQEK